MSSEEIIELYLQVRSDSVVCNFDTCNREKSHKVQPALLQNIPITVTFLNLIGDGWLPSNYTRIENGSAYWVGDITNDPAQRDQNACSTLEKPR